MSELTGWSFVEEDEDQVSNLEGYDFEEEGQAVSDKFILDKVGNPLYENPTKAEYLAYEAARDREDVPFVATVGEAAEMAWRDITGFFSGLIDLAEKGEYTEAGKALVEGGVRGTSDLGTLVRKGIYDNVKYAMGDEDDDYQNFLAARKLDAMRERARLGDQGLVFDLIPEANKVAEGFSYVADPSVIIPGAGLATKATTKVGSLASRGAGEVLSLGGRALSYPAQKIGDAATGVAETVGAATMRKPGLLTATAQSTGTVGSGLQTMGELFSEVGQQMTKRPSQMGLLKSIEYSAEASDAVRKLAGRSARFLDPALSVMGRAVEGVSTGAAVGGTLGLAAEGERGLYSGIGAGGVLGGTATGIGIVAGKVTGVTQKNRIRNDFNRWLKTLPEDQAKRVANTVGKDTNAMAELVGADALAVGAFGKDTIVEFLDSKGVAERRADYHRRETGKEVSPEVFEKDNLHGVHFIDLTTDGQRPTVLINTDYKSNPGHTMVHEVFHAINRLDGMGDYTSRLYSGIIGTFVEAGQIKPGLLTPEQFNSIADQYASRFLVKAEKGGLELKDKAGKFTLDSIDKYNSIKGDKKVILEEIGAELFAALLTGKGKASYLVPGKGIDTLTRTYLDRLLMSDAESRLGRMANMLENIYSGLRFDRVTGDTMFTVDGAPLKADPQLNAIMRDMVRAKRAIRTTMDVAAGDKKVTVIKPRTVGSRGVKKLHDMVRDTPVEAIFETDSKGRSKVKKAEETHKTEVEQSKKIIDAVSKAPDDGKAGTVRKTVNEKGEEVLVGQRFSPEQIEEIKKIPGINNKVVQYLEMLNEIMASGRQIDIEYYAATRLNRKGQRAYSSGIKHTRRHVVPYSIEISASGNFFVKSLDVNKLAGKVDQWKKSRKAWLKNWTNMDEFYSDVARYLQNLASPEPKQSSKLFGETKRNILNELMGARGRKGFNPLALEKVAEKDFLIRSFRVDRVTEMNADSSLSPIKADLPYSEQSYTLQKENFMPAGKLSKKEEGKLKKEAIAEGKRTIKETKQKHPEAVILEIAKDKKGEEKVVVKTDANGNPTGFKPAYKQAPYALLKSPKIARYKNYETKVDKAADLLEPEVRKFLNVPDIAAGKGWYSRMRVFLQKTFGASIEMFGQLLGATSARTPVDTNFKQALEALQLLGKGQYDDLLTRFHQHVVQANEKLKNGELEKEHNARGAKAKYDPAKAFRREVGLFPDVPLRSNGAKYNANSTKVLHTLYGNWLEMTSGPKTPNFAGNLTGRTFEATIDVWAARLLRRLLYEGKGGVKNWRILPQQEKGVDYTVNVKGEYGGDFTFGQDVFRKVADKLGMNPDDLQAIAWFGEKDIWEKNGWTNIVGAEKSSFDKEAGKLDLQRFQLGVTTFTEPTKFDPVRQESERQSLRNVIGQTPGMISSRVNHSEGLYANTPEPTIDAEFSLQKGSNATAVVAEMIRIGQDNNQIDVFASTIVDADHPNARPMVEVGFKSPATKNEIQTVMDTFRNNGVDGFTLAKDSQDQVIGIRAQYIPEISARYDTVESLQSDKFLSDSDLWMSNVQASTSVITQSNNISYAQEGYVSTVVYGKEEYGKAKPQDPSGSSRSEELGRRASILGSEQFLPAGSEVLRRDGAGAATIGEGFPDVGGSSASRSGGLNFLPADREGNPPKADKGININDSTQPFTSQILAKEKTEETRESRTLDPYVGKIIGLIKTGQGQAQHVGYARVGKPIVYKTEKQFRSGFKRHRIEKGSSYDWKGKTKYAYPLTNVEQIDPVPITSRGIVSRQLYLPAESVGDSVGVRSSDGSFILKTKSGKFRVYGANKSLLGVASSEKAAERLLRGGVKKNNIRQRPTRGLSR